MLNHANFPEPYSGCDGSSRGSFGGCPQRVPAVGDAGSSRQLQFAMRFSVLGIGRPWAGGASRSHLPVTPFPSRGAPSKKYESGILTILQPQDTLQCKVNNHE